MTEGFSLELEDYCSYCGYFEPNIDRLDVTSCKDTANKYITVIKCQNAYRCERIKANMERRSDE